MDVSELPREGLLRRFRLGLPPGPIAAECARRVAELAVGLDQNGAVPEAQRAAMLSRSEAAINADILGKAIEGAIGNILRDAGIRPAARPTITLEPRTGDGDYIVTIIVEALPDVVVPRLADIVLDRPVAEPDGDEIEAAVEALRRRHGVWHALADVGAEIGDEITCDIGGWLAPEPPTAAPSPHPALRAERFAWRLGEEGVLPGLDAELVGLRPGEVRQVALAGPLRSATLPDELAGRPLVLEARAHGLRRLALPELDADFAKLCGHADLAELRLALADELRQAFAAMTTRLLRQALLARLAVLDVPAGLPRSLVENEFRLLTQSSPQGDAAGLRDLAERRLTLRMVLRKLGDGFGLNIAATDLEAALARESQRFPGQEAEALAFLRRNAAAARRVADQLWTRRVIEHALSLVQVRDQPVTPAALRAAAALGAGEPGLDEAHA